MNRNFHINDLSYNYFEHDTVLSEAALQQDISWKFIRYLYERQNMLGVMDMGCPVR